MHEAVITNQKPTSDGQPTYRPSTYQEPLNQSYQNRLELHTTQENSYERTNTLRETQRPPTNPWSYSTS